MDIDFFASQKSGQKGGIGAFTFRRVIIIPSNLISKKITTLICSNDWAINIDETSIIK